MSASNKLIKAKSSLSEDQHRDIDLLNVGLSMDQPALVQKSCSGNMSFEKMCSGLDLDDLLRAGSSDELVEFLRKTSSNLSSGSSKELLDIILNDESMRATPAAGLVRAASMRSDGDLFCDELLQLSDDQLSQFLRRPTDAPGGAGHLTEVLPNAQARGAAWRAHQHPPGNQHAPRCPDGHQCAASVKIDGDYIGGEFACDRCSTICQANRERWHCGICNVDYCYTCTPVSQMTPKTEIPETQQKRRPKVVYPKGETIHWNRERKPARDMQSPNNKVNEYSRIRSYLDADDGVDQWEFKRIVMKKGKYQGRGAFVKERVNRKYRVMVDGVEDQLEFYPASFSHVIV